MTLAGHTTGGTGSSGGEGTGNSLLLLLCCTCKLPELSYRMTCESLMYTFTVSLLYTTCV